ncbi:MAG: acyltransferase, partial [Pseudomonadota bacterium]
LLLHSFDTVGGYSLNSPSWSISAEFYTYLIFAVLLIKFPKIIWLWMPAIIMGGLIFFYFFDGKNATHNWGIFRCVYGFAAGGLAYILWEKTNIFVAKILNKHLWHLLETLTVGLAIFLILNQNLILVSLTPFIFGVLIFIFAFEKGLFSKILQHRFFLLLGLLSYSIYMWHAFIAWKVVAPIFMILEKITGQDFTSTSERLGMRIDVGLIAGDAITLIYLGAVILVSYISYRFFEDPARRYIGK